VLFAHDTTTALAIAADLVNDDDLATPEAIDAFLDAHDVVPHPVATARDVTAGGRPAPRLRELWDTPDIRQLAARVNDLLGESGARPWLTDHDGTHGWHLHATDPGASIEHRIVAQVAFAFADVIRLGETSRLRRCAAPECQAVLVDLSRNRSRIYCDTGNCGNRQHVAAYRARKSLLSRR
jgi:predicted RNA-binding Zn ribbon-like protein